MSTYREIPAHIIKPAETIRQSDDIKESVKELSEIPVMRALSVARGVYWRIARPRTFGAAVAITDGSVEQIALVRTTYGNRKLWQLPGGGLDKPDRRTAQELFESGAIDFDPELFEPSARREVREEIGVDAADVSLTHLLNYDSDRDSYGRLANRDTLGIFHLALDGIQVDDLIPQRSEIEEVKMWDVDSLPHFRGASYLGNVALALQLQRAQ